MQDEKTNFNKALVVDASKMDNSIKPGWLNVEVRKYKTIKEGKHVRILSKPMAGVLIKTISGKVHSMLIPYALVNRVGAQYRIKVEVFTDGLIEGRAMVKLPKGSINKHRIIVVSKNELWMKKEEPKKKTFLDYEYTEKLFSCLGIKKS